MPRFVPIPLKPTSVVGGLPDGVVRYTTAPFPERVRVSGLAGTNNPYWRLFRVCAGPVCLYDGGEDPPALGDYEGALTLSDLVEGADVPAGQSLYLDVDLGHGSPDGVRLWAIAHPSLRARGIRVAADWPDLAGAEEVERRVDLAERVSDGAEGVVLAALDAADAIQDAERAEVGDDRGGAWLAFRERAREMVVEDEPPAGEQLRHLRVAAVALRSATDVVEGQLDRARPKDATVQDLLAELRREDCSNADAFQIGRLAVMALAKMEGPAAAAAMVDVLAAAPDEGFSTFATPTKFPRPDAAFVESWKAAVVASPGARASLRQLLDRSHEVLQFAMDVSLLIEAGLRAAGVRFGDGQVGDAGEIDAEFEESDECPDCGSDDDAPGLLESDADELLDEESDECPDCGRTGGSHALGCVHDEYEDA